MNQPPNNTEKKLQKQCTANRRRRIIAILVAILLTLSLLLIAGGIYFWQLIGKVNNNNDNKSFVDSLEAVPLDSDFSGTIIDDPVDINDAAKSVNDIKVQGDTKVITNILLLGIETGDMNNYIGRSDSMIILTINRFNKTIKMTSLMRDLYVSIPSHGFNKLNASYALGGFDLLSKTIEKNFRIKIDKYIAVNFSAFAKAVNAMGGIDLDLSAEEAKLIGCGSKDGNYHLDGDQALYYSRIRSIKDSEGNRDDWGRTSRQRIVVQKLMSKAKTMSIGTMNELLNKMLPEISTNMKTDEFANYIFQSPTYLKYEVSQYYVPHQGEYETYGVKGIGEVLALKDAKNVVIQLHHQIYG